MDQLENSEDVSFNIGGRKPGKNIFVPMKCAPESKGHFRVAHQAGIRRGTTNCIVIPVKSSSIINSRCG
ncbi:hypothetical protein ACH3XW_42865 [Acanthocheilonema viteae]